ncbi:MAG: cytochrome D ubiquinol oxidase subunit II, partial [Nitrospirota bacterium]
MKTSQIRSHPLPSNEELLSQIRLLLDSPEDDLQAAIMKELLAGTLRLHSSHLDILDLKIVNRAVK